MIQLDIKDITIKPYVRMTRSGKWVKPEAQQYLASKGRLAARIREQLHLQGKEPYPGQTPLKVVIRLYAPTNPGHRCDLDNQVKAILDACNGVAFPDDRWVDQIDAQRFHGQECRLRLMIMQCGFKK